MTATETYAAWLKGKRKNLKESYATVAARAEVSVATVFAIERGESSPSLETAEKLAKAFGTSLEAAIRKRTNTKLKPGTVSAAEAILGDA